MSFPHIGTAGAGLAHRLLAWRLLRVGCRVSLFDARLRAHAGSASMTAAAMLSPLAELAVSDDAVFALGQRSMQLWPCWMEKLKAAGARRLCIFTSMARWWWLMRLIGRRWSISRAYCITSYPKPAVRRRTSWTVLRSRSMSRPWLGALVAAYFWKVRVS